jgi:hypothetical protein
MPPESLVAKAKGVSRENIIALLQEFPYLIECYSYIRQKLDVIRQPSILPTAACKIFAESAPLEDVIWWYEEFHCTAVEPIVNQRLCECDENDPFYLGSGQRSSYGKIMERLLYFRKKKYSIQHPLKLIADAQLKQLTLRKSESIKIAVLGDASGSMGVAVRCATIIASLLSCVLDADLVFFNGDCIKPPIVPRTVSDTIRVVNKIKADGSTSMAAALYPYYNKKTKIDLFVLVSDEEENTESHGFMFADLFKKYRQEINPFCDLFFVSFLDAQLGKGQIQQSMEAEGIFDWRVFRLHPSKPDTSKFDVLLGMIVLLLECKNAVLQEIFHVIKQMFMQTKNNEIAKYITDIIFLYL